MHRAIADADLRRVLIGIAMGLTAIALIYSPWGKRSGAHMNPAVTLTFLRLGKMRAETPSSTCWRSSSAARSACWSSALFGNALAAPPVDFCDVPRARRAARVRRRDLHFVP